MKIIYIILAIILMLIYLVPLLAYFTTRKLSKRFKAAWLQNFAAWLYEVVIEPC